MSFTFVRRIAIAALALPLLLGGCADDEPVPKVPGTSSPTSPVTETSTAPVEPTLPPEAEGKGPKAAEAFVRYYYDTVNYAQQTCDTKHLRSLGAEFCDACIGGADALDAIYRQGGMITGGEATVDKARVTGVRQFQNDIEIYYLTVTVTNTDQTVSGSQDLDGDYPADTVRLRFEVASSDVGFQISKWYEQ